MERSGREHERVRTELPLRLDGGAQGQARDISESGIYFETDAEMTPGSAIRFTIRLESGGRRYTADCVGEVVRVQQGDGRVGVGARILEAKLEMSD